MGRSAVANRRHYYRRPDYKAQEAEQVRFALIETIVLERGVDNSQRLLTRRQQGA
jgi:hypothetical protein